MNRRTRIIIAEPSAIVGRGLKDIVCSNGDYEVALFSDINQFIDKLPVYHPDVIVINPFIADTGRKGTPLRSIYPAFAGIPLIALCSTLLPEEVLKLYDDTISILEEPQAVIKKLRQAVESPGSQTDPAEGNELSDREKEILVAVAKGLANKEIAERHNISIHTVISHRKNISRKTGIKTVSGLTIYALLNNLIDMADAESATMK